MAVILKNSEYEVYPSNEELNRTADFIKETFGFTDVTELHIVPLDKGTHTAYKMIIMQKTLI